MIFRQNYRQEKARAEEAGQKFDVASARIKQVEARLSGLSELRTHIINYSKTRAVYAAFQKAKNKKDYRLAHKSELAMHEAAKKKELYKTYKAARKDMIAYQTAKQNIDRLLRIQPTQEQHRKTER